MVGWCEGIGVGMGEVYIYLYIDCFLGLLVDRGFDALERRCSPGQGRIQEHL